MSLKGFSSVHLEYCCGIQEVGQFLEFGYSQDLEDDLGDLDEGLERGSGRFISTFINNPVCKEAYELFCKRYKLLYQSEPEMNNNSGNCVFVCVFELKGN